MPSITYINHSGDETVVDVATGVSIMKGAIDYGISGIDADCGGECSCATCHVIVQEEWMSTVGSAEEIEESMLDMNPDREANSRLSCQVKVTEAMDGLRVQIPEFQM